MEAELAAADEAARRLERLVHNLAHTLHMRASLYSILFIHPAAP
jgi:hypothetical protein